MHKTSTMNQKSKMEGLLEKSRSGIVMGKDKCHCRLQEFHFFYNKQSSTSLGRRQSLQSETAIPIAEIYSVKPVLKSKKASQFELCTQDKTHTFTAANDKERDAWVEKLREALSAVKSLPLIEKSGSRPPSGERSFVRSYSETTSDPDAGLYSSIDPNPYDYARVKERTPSSYEPRSESGYYSEIPVTPQEEKINGLQSEVLEEEDLTDHVYSSVNKPAVQQGAKPEKPAKPSKPSISSPKPSITSPKPSITSPKPSISSPKPSVSSIDEEQDQSNKENVFSSPSNTDPYAGIRRTSRSSVGAYPRSPKSPSMDEGAVMAAFDKEMEDLYQSLTPQQQDEDAKQIQDLVLRSRFPPIPPLPFSSRDVNKASVSELRQLLQESGGPVAPPRRGSGKGPGRESSIAALKTQLSQVEEVENDDDDVFSTSL